MKRLLACMAAGAMIFALGACGTVTSEPESDTEEAPAAVVEEELTEETDPAENEEEPFDGEEAPDVSGAIEGTQTSIDDPVPFGEWVKTTLYATQDDTFHTVYVRITGVTTQGRDTNYVVSAINTNNENVVEDDWISASDLDIPSDGEIVVLDYEVYVPEDFPSPSYGMAEPRLYFTVKNVNGTGIPSAYGDQTYVGLSKTYDLTVREPEAAYFPGNVYSERCLYVMVKGYTDYVVTYFTFPEGTTSEEMGTEILYTVYHAVR